MTEAGDSARPARPVAHVAATASAPAVAESKDTGRLEAFSDGVFAIAITLLVLDLHLPTGAAVESDAALFQALLHLGPTYLAFLTSFIFIGIMWINHHRLFTHIQRTDTGLLLYNLLLLLGVTVVPFPTALVADRMGAGGQTAAVLVYSGWFVGIAVFFNLLWLHASRGNRLLDPQTDPVAVQAITRQFRFGPLLYLVAFALAFANVWISLLMSLLLAIFFAVPGPALGLVAAASAPPSSDRG